MLKLSLFNYYFAEITFSINKTNELKIISGQSVREITVIFVLCT